MKKSTLIVVIFVFLGFILNACAGSRRTGEGVPSRPAAAFQCPDEVSESQWGALAEQCKGRLALSTAEKAAASEDWVRAVRWSALAEEHLVDVLRPQARLLLAESRYALGQTDGVAKEILDNIDEADDRVRARLFYYLGEIGLAGDDSVRAVEHLSEALAGATAGVSWRPAAAALLEAAALQAIDLDAATLAAAPASLEPLRKLAEVDQALREGRTSEARVILEDLVESAAIQRLGLTKPVESRLAEVQMRGHGARGHVGIVLPLSGRAGLFGNYVLRGVILGTDVFTSPGRKLLIEDDRGEPFRSERAMRLLASRGAMAVIGPLLGRGAEKGAQTANRMGLPTVVLSSAKLPALSPWVVRDAVTPRQQVEALLDETMVRRGFNRFAIFHPTDSFGVGMRDIFWDAVIERGGKITGVETYEPASTDFRTGIGKIVGADDFTPEELEERKANNQPLAHLDFDALFIPDGAKTVGLILPQLLYFDVRGPVFMGPSTWNDPRLVKLGREYAEGALFVDWYFTESDKEATKEFLQKYASSFGGNDPPSVTAQGYDAGVLISEVVDAENRNQARERLYARDWHSFSGPAEVTESGEVKKPLVMLTVVGRRIVPIDQSPAY